MMASNTNVPLKGRIQKRKTHHLQIITFGLQRAAGPYRRATSRRPELSTRLKDHVERLLGSAAKARKTRLSRDLAQSTLAGLGTESQCHLLR